MNIVKRIFRPEYRIVYQGGVYHLQKQGMFSDWFYDVDYFYTHSGAATEFEIRKVLGQFIIKPKLLYTIYLDSTKS
ncbi:hypothetical protein [Hafnia phage Pocis76]|uniref:Uncharacterized protein n=1 Tax=Hafnia phage Pocis76 TaxID=2831174 RepID=A0A8E7FN06_9CAUD|nr:hypothetical protein [Hafnia phage Pocis76]